MRKVLFILASLPFISFSQVMLEDFESNRNIHYGFISGDFDPPGLASIVGAATNPDQTGVNTSQFCGKYTRNETEEYDVILFNPYSGNFSDLEDFSNETKTISIDIWSPIENTVVEITFENSNMAEPDNFPIGRHSRFIATTTLTNQWETLTFSLNKSETLDPETMAANVDQGVILINPLSDDNSTYYLDNFSGPNHDCIEATANNQILDDFECQRNGEYNFTHGNLQIINNPDISGVNTSKKVGKYTRSDFTTNDVIIFEFDQELNLANNEIISLKVWSSFSKDVVISLQDEQGIDGPNTFNQTASLPGNSSWQEYTFNYSGLIPADVNITQAVFLFAPDEAGFPYEFYYDDFSITETSAIEDGQSKDAFSIIQNIIHFDNTNTKKQIRIFDLNGKLLENTIVSSNSFQIKHKGMLLINIIENKNSTSIKHLIN
jgi:hypothetical protein